MNNWAQSTQDYMTIVPNLEVQTNLVVYGFGKIESPPFENKSLNVNCLLCSAVFLRFMSFASLEECLFDTLSELNTKCVDLYKRHCFVSLHQLVVSHAFVI